MLLIIVTGCTQEAEFPNPLLTTVPVNTPYLSASGKPAPEALNERFREALAPMFDDLGTRLRKALKSLEAQRPALARKLRAAMTAFLKVATAEDGLARLEDVSTGLLDWQERSSQARYGNSRGRTLARILHQPATGRAICL